MTTSERLRNWAGNHTYPASVVHRPRTVEQVQELVAASSRVRAVGSRHSFNDLVDSPALVSLDALPALHDLDPASGTVRVGAAVRYGELAAHLHARGWALHNLASLPHISVAGAVATATHGSGDRSANLATAVTGLELVTADGSLLTLTRADAELAGAVVGLGALGVVTALTLEIEPTYDVVQEVHTGLPWWAVLDDVDAVLGSADSVSLFTDWRGESVAQVWRKSRVPLAVTPFAAHGAVAASTDQHPLAGGDAASTTAQLGVAGPWHERLPHFRMDFVPSAGAELQSEYFVDRREAGAAIEAVRRLGERLAPVLLVSEVRSVAADELWLSMAHGRDSVGLHFTWKPLQEEVDALLPAVEGALAPYAARPHWGKLFFDADRSLARVYPRLDDFRALAARLDPEGTFRNSFLDRHVLGAAG
ncbi:MAG: FAD-binding protein [Frankiaceae bacterium]|nr:FAD-binding protein [Frankiaceae bacterium]